MAFDYDAHKDLILELKEKGLTSNDIAREFKSMGLQVPKTAASSIRRALARWNNKDIGIEAENYFRAEGLDSSHPWDIAWLKTKGLSVRIKNPNDGLPTGKTLDEIRQEFSEEMKKYSPEYKEIERHEVTDPHCLVIDIADLHIGKLASSTESGEEYNVDIAVDQARKGLSGILSKSKGFNYDQIVFVIGNDILHTDNTKGTTTSGTPQDTDGMWYDNFKIARALYVSMIESLMQICDVHVIHCPSNHDFMTGFMLADSVHSWFHDSRNVTFDVSMAHRKYYKYGNSLMSFSHGDGAKVTQLPILMAQEVSQMWADTRYRYVYLHHVHHKKKNVNVGEETGVLIEYLRSPSSADSWHHRNGYQHSVKAIEAFVHSESEGRVASFIQPVSQKTD